MREVKFRLTRDGKIVGYEWHRPLTIGDGHVEIFHSSDGNEWHNIQASTYQFIEHDSKEAYIGHIDSKRREIYVNDVVEHLDGEFSFTAVVEWADYGWYMHGVAPIDNFSFDDIGADELTVIGYKNDYPDYREPTNAN